MTVNDCSVIIIARNEAHVIGRCLDSVRGFSEIIVLDDESTDETAAICRNYPQVRLFRRPMTQGFGPQKNCALGLTTKPWVLSLDADEYLDEALCAEIALQTASSPADGFRVRRNNLIFGAWLADHRPQMIRLFRRDKGHFTNKHVDEAVVVNGVVQDLQQVLWHTSASHVTPGQYYRVIVQERSWATARDLHAQGRRFCVWALPVDLFVRPAAVFLQKLFWKQGISYGWRGVVLAFFSALAYARSYALLRKVGR